MELFDAKTFAEKMSKAKTYLPAQYFVDFDDQEDVEYNKDRLFEFNGEKYIQVYSPDVRAYSFESNRIKFDSDWYSDFMIEFPD